MRSLNVEQFERLKIGDLVRVESTGEVLMVNQFRFPGCYVAGRVNPKTCERLDRAMRLLTPAILCFPPQAASGEGPISPLLP